MGLASFRKYAQAIYAASDEYLDSLTNDDLNRTVNFSILGLGEANLKFVLTHGMPGNALTHGGEIFSLKGLQGRRGYLF